MFEQSAIAVYDSKSKAAEAVYALQQGNFPLDRVSIITQNLESKKKVHRYVGNAGDGAKVGALAGVFFGWVFGVIAGAALIWVPGVGPMLVFEHLASTALLGGIEGVVAGAAGGGLLGALVDWVLSKKSVLKYKEKLKNGKYLVIVHGSVEELARDQNILVNTNAEELKNHLETHT